MSNVLPLPIDRNLHFSTQVDQKTIGEITKEIIRINESDEYLEKLYDINGQTYTPKPIKIYIDSYGGMAYQIFGLVSIIGKSKTEIHTICTGCAMSCGFILLVSGHKRFAYEHSTPLYHQVSAGAVGKLKDMEERVEETKRLQEQMEKYVLDRTKITEKKLKKIYKRKIDWFMTSEEALKLGVIDEII